MTLFEILSHNERIVVHSDSGDKVLYTWNQSLTFQCWRQSNPIFCTMSELLEHNVWEEIAVRTVSKEPKNFEAARKVAMAWAQE